MSSSLFNFSLYKISLYDKFIEKSKREEKLFEEIIQDYNSLLLKQYIIKKELNTLSIDERKDSKVIKQKKGSQIMNIHNSNSNIVNISTIQNEELEKENKNLIRESKLLNEKLIEYMSENIKLKELISLYEKESLSLNNRLNESLTLINSLEDENSKLLYDNSKLKEENFIFEKTNLELSSKYSKTINENQNLINEILTIKNDYALKMNEMLDLHEEAKSKKAAADLYYNNKKDEYKASSSLLEMSSKLDEFKILVEEVKIPNKVKCKLPAHKKNITEIYFNPFGSNFISCSSDYFIKNWDSAKSKCYKFMLIYTFLTIYAYII